MELSNDIDVLKELIGQLLTRINELESENAALRLRLGQNSKNSHKPPSSDGLTKKPAFSQSQGKKTGGQVGHEGKTLSMVSNPDDVVVHHAPHCPCCKKVFMASDIDLIIQKRQVFDIPNPKLEVTEHQVGVIVCCGQLHKGSFPAAVSRPVQYGSKIKALSVLLNTDYKLPFEKIEQLFGDIYGCSFNESTAIPANTTCFESLEVVETRIKQQLLDSSVVHFDETGMRVAGKLHWFHTVSNRFLTYLFVHTHRGKEALNSAQSLIKDFKNRAVHDCWASYFDFTDCSHAICNAHILRELEALKETNSLWASQMQELLLQMFNESQRATIILDNKSEWIAKYQTICQTAQLEEPPPIKGKRGRYKNSKGRNLLNRLIKYQNDVLAFAFFEDVPFTNNQAERDIRPLKTKQKVANSFRTFNGAQHYARIQSFVSTCRKQKMNVFQKLCKIFNKQNVNFQTA